MTKNAKKLHKTARNDTKLLKMTQKLIKITKIKKIILFFNCLLFKKKKSFHYHILIQYFHYPKLKMSFSLPPLWPTLKNKKFKPGAITIFNFLSPA